MSDHHPPDPDPTSTVAEPSRIVDLVTEHHRPERVPKSTLVALPRIVGCMDHPSSEPEFSLQVRRGARRTHLIAAARGAPAMVLAIAVLVLAVALAIYCLRAPASPMGHRSTQPPSELPVGASGSLTSRAVSTPRPAGASLVLMTRTPPGPDPISTAAEFSRAGVS